MEARRAFSYPRTVAKLGIRQGRLLDVGCLWGFFLSNARQKRFEVSGVEPLSKAVRYVRDILGLPAYQGNLACAALPASSFDVVTMFDVIEHLPNPVAELREVFRILRPGGMVLVVTPNIDGLAPRLIGFKRRAFHQPWCPIDDIPWHLWGFTSSTISKCVEKAGFQVESVEFIEPSLKTTNRVAGSAAWKQIGLQMVAEASRLFRMSDRMIVSARKRRLP